MKNGKNINTDELNSLIREASKSSGVNENAIREAANGGGIDKVLANLNPEQAKTLQKILSDKKAAKELLSTPEARKLLVKILGEKKNG